MHSPCAAPGRGRGFPTSGLARKFVLARAAAVAEDDAAGGVEALILIGGYGGFSLDAVCKSTKKSRHTAVPLSVATRPGRIGRAMGILARRRV